MYTYEASVGSRTHPVRNPQRGFYSKNLPQLSRPAVRSATLLLPYYYTVASIPIFSPKNFPFPLKIDNFFASKKGNFYMALLGPTFEAYSGRCSASGFIAWPPYCGWNKLWKIYPRITHSYKNYPRCKILYLRPFILRALKRQQNAKDGWKVFFGLTAAHPPPSTLSRARSCRSGYL